MPFCHEKKVHCHTLKVKNKLDTAVIGNCLCGCFVSQFLCIYKSNFTSLVYMDLSSNMKHVLLSWAVSEYDYCCIMTVPLYTIVNKRICILSFLSVVKTRFYIWSWVKTWITCRFFFCVHLVQTLNMSKS